MEKGLIVSKWVLINRPKIPQMPQDLFVQIVCPSPKFWDFNEKRLHCVSVFRAFIHNQCTVLQDSFKTFDEPLFLSW